MSWPRSPPAQHSFLPLPLLTAKPVLPSVKHTRCPAFTLPVPHTPSNCPRCPRTTGLLGASLTPPSLGSLLSDGSSAFAYGSSLDHGQSSSDRSPGWDSPWARTRYRRCQPRGQPETQTQSNQATSPGGKGLSLSAGENCHHKARKAEGEEIALVKKALEDGFTESQNPA